MATRRRHSGRPERRARWFFGAHLQSGLGAGAGYIALLVLAYDRIGSAWGATAILLADLLPAMLLGPLLGAAIDRTSKLGAAILADVVRALAFAGLVIFDGTASMVILAFVAGAGTALFRPATYALLPRLVAADRLPAANGLYGAVRETGFLLGPALAAGLLAVTTPAIVLGVNAATFALCALALLPLRGHVREVTADAPDAEHGPESVRDVLRHRLVRTLMATSAVVTLAAGTMNIAELVFAHDELGVGATGFGLLVSAYGFGLIGGSIYAGRERGRRAPPLLRRAGRARARAAGHRRRADARGRDGAVRRRRARQRPLLGQQPHDAPRARSRSASTAACSASSTPATAGASASP